MSPIRLCRVLFVVAAAAIVLPTVSASGAAAPDLRGFHAYSGSYVRGSSSEGFAIEVEKQKGRDLSKVRINAANEREFIGTGKISKDLTTFTIKTHTDDKKKKDRTTLNLMGQLPNGNVTLEGTYDLRHPLGTPISGTFSLSR